MARAAHRRLATVLALVLAAAGAGCKGSDDTLLVVTVDLHTPAPAAPITALEVKITAGSAAGDHAFVDPRGMALVFPSDFSLQLPARVGGVFNLEVIARGTSGQNLAGRTVEGLTVTTSARTNIAIDLVCLVDCVGDGGIADAARPDLSVPETPAGMMDPYTCGNGRLDDGEICDTAIWSGRPGACPPADCDDGFACTTDVAIGTGCQLTCSHQAITKPAALDRCCPAGQTVATDLDCSETCGNGTREANESCDTAAAAGAAAACPAANSCDDSNPCTADELLSADTCAAQCVHHPITASTPNDGCCPVGALAAIDNDCRSVCGNWQKDPGELCDRAQPSAGAAGCPSSCPATSADPCAMSTLSGTGCGIQCVTSAVVLAIPGDRCCPQNANRNLDADCPSLCGNGLLESGEACDRGIAFGQPGACPRACAEAAGSCLVTRISGSADDCSVRCTTEPIRDCSLMKDGCCPSGCTTALDADCVATCGNGVIDSAEICDTAIAAGMPGACPTACTDADTCTTDRLLAAGTCHARCAHLPITQFVTGDGCCPTGGHNLLDNDCPAVCGNAVVEGPQETCDRALPPGMPGACRSTCPQLAPGCTRHALQGAAETCSSRCVVETVTACVSNDGCCAPGCTRPSDNDCPAVCGNNVIEDGETCDVGLSAGTSGSCAALCNDDDACTADVTLGRRIDCTRICRFDPITACHSGDRCCPAGCSVDTDKDCAIPICGNRVIEATESCDPPGACPTRCPDDGDACTSELLVGDAKACNARCLSTPIRACSGATNDGCCPTGCVPKTDVDCNTPTAEPPVL